MGESRAADTSRDHLARGRSQTWRASVDRERIAILRRDIDPAAAMRELPGAQAVNGRDVVAMSQWLGHSSLQITRRVYSYRMANDQGVGRAAMSKTLSKVVPDVYPACTSPTAGRI